MKQLSENVVVLEMGDVIPEEANTWIKIYLAGSVDLSGSEEYNWQDKFCAGLIKLVDPKDGVMMYNRFKYLIINPRFQANNQTLSLENPEFVQKFNWSQSMINSADGVFLNFLKKSTSAPTLLEFGQLSNSGKLVVRSSQEYIYYPYVKLICENNRIPLLPGSTGTVLSVIQSLYSFIPKFQEVLKYSLPE